MHLALQHVYIFLCFEDSLLGEPDSCFLPLFFPFCFFVLQLWHTLFQWGVLFFCAALDILILFSLLTNALAINSCILCCCNMTCLLVSRSHRKKLLCTMVRCLCSFAVSRFHFTRKKAKCFWNKMLLFYTLINFNLFSFLSLWSLLSAILYQGIKLDEWFGLECTSSLASEHHLHH